MFTVSDARSQRALQLKTMLKVNTITSIFSIGLFNGAPRLHLVSAQVTGTPLMPQTGSDPTARVSQPVEMDQWIWLLGTGIIMLIGLYIVSRGAGERKR
jgi:hypothetical protein